MPIPPSATIPVPVQLWADVLATLEERIDTADYLKPEKYDDVEHRRTCERTANAARAVLKKARKLSTP